MSAQTDGLIDTAIAEEEARIGHELPATDRKAIATKIELVEEGGGSVQVATTADGLFRDTPSRIATYGGGTIDPLDPDPADINILTIAHSLSQQCRWTGHTSQFYSVAEHCVHASFIEPTLACLLHDASEAYLSDLARPIKHAKGLGTVYLIVEAGLERAISERFGLEPPPMSARVKAADDAMLRQEATMLLPSFGKILGKPPRGTPRCQCWYPPEAEEWFLTRFADLGGRA